MLRSRRGCLEEMYLVLDLIGTMLLVLCAFLQSNQPKSKESAPECLLGKMPFVLSSDAAVESQKKRYFVDAVADGNPLAMSQKARDDALSRIPSGRFGSVDEVADAALFLATNAYANNCVINLDGGLSAV